MTAKYTMSKSGVTEILKSSEMKEALEEAARKKAAQANALLHAHDKNAGAHEYKVDLHDLTYTSIATVHTTGFTTERDHAEHQTLNAINH